MFFDNGRDLGTFASKPIKVISKPTRKKSSVANADMCIESGSEIALFNRIRSQAGSTRYLAGSANGFDSSTRDWSTLKITNASSIHRGRADGAQNLGDRINYAAEIVLEDEENNMVSSTFEIRKVEKNTVVASASDPVSQLQKIALHIKGSDRAYLGFFDGKVQACVASGTLKDNSSGEMRDYISDGCVWTIASTDRVEYTFCDQRPSSTNTVIPVEPVPTVQYTKNHGSVVEIYGENFNEQHSVWFDDVQCETNLRCHELLLCKPPLIAEFMGGSDIVCREEKTVSILIVRSDGVIYPTGTTYTYDVDPIVVLQMAERDAAQAAQASAAVAAVAGAALAPLLQSAPIAVAAGEGQLGQAQDGAVQAAAEDTLSRTAQQHPPTE
jgi:recombining binding protein (suppressor of hairless)